MPRRIETTSPEETERAGAELAATLAPGAVVLVSGDLGAGKTTFVRGAARALGVTEPVTSPTFVVGHLFQGARTAVAHLDLYRLAGLHLDLYRLAGLADEDPGLLDPYFGPDVVSFVEWPEHAGDDEAAAGGRAVAHRVRLEHAGGDRRHVEVG
jgi:tRNA threonylcarbamoyladenosine biosynthesis protein TsaE